MSVADARAWIGSLSKNRTNVAAAYGLVPIFPHHQHHRRQREGYFFEDRVARISGRPIADQHLAIQTAGRRFKQPAQTATRHFLTIAAKFTVPSLGLNDPLTKRAVCGMGSYHPRRSDGSTTTPMSARSGRAG
jgi:hypothetical protein